MSRSVLVLVALFAPHLLVARADADVQIFTNYGDWATTAPGVDQKLDFVFGSVQPLYEQYSQFGVHFAPGAAGAGGVIPSSDGWGFISSFTARGVVPVSFDTEQHAFAVDYVDLAVLSFYLHDDLIYESAPFFTFDPPKFRGFVLDTAFDKVVINTGGLEDTVIIDNCYVGSPVPAASSVPAIACLLLVRGRRRRSP